MGIDIKDQTKTPIEHLLSGSSLHTLSKFSIFLLGKEGGNIIRGEIGKGVYGIALDAHFIVEVGPCAVT